MKKQILEEKAKIKKLIIEKGKNGGKTLERRAENEDKKNELMNRIKME